MRQRFAALRRRLKRMREPLKTRAPLIAMAVGIGIILASIVSTPTVPAAPAIGSVSASSAPASPLPLGNLAPATSTYATPWSLVELLDHAQAGEVLSVTLTSLTSAPGNVRGGTPPTSLIPVAVLRNGTQVPIALSVTFDAAMQSLRSAGFGSLLSGEILTQQAVAASPNPDPLGTIRSLSVIAGLGLLLVGFLIFITRRRDPARRNLAMAGPRGADGKPISGNRGTIPAGQQVHLSDVAGCDEAKLEVTEAIEFLRQPERFARLGARVPRGLLFYGPPGTGKCIVGDSLVLTDRGIIRMDTIPERYRVLPDARVLGAEVISLDSESGHFVRREASHFHALGKQDTRRITTSQGAILEGTPEHPIIALDEHGSLAFRRLQDLSVGDIVALAVGTNAFGTRTTVRPDEAYMLGLLTGDGGLTTSGRITLTTIDQEIETAFRKYASDWGPVYTKGYDLNVASWALKQHLFALGLKSVPSWAKQVPITVLEAPREIQVEFLRGLFDTDGGVESKNCVVTYSTSSPRLAQEVNAMLLNLGICAHIRVRLPKFPNARLSHGFFISGNALVPFATTIGFRLLRKSKVLTALVSNQDRMGANTNIDVLHRQAARIEAIWRPISLARKSSQNMANLVHKVRQYGRITRPQAQWFLDQTLERGFSSPATDELRRLTNLPAFFTKVRSITSRQAEVFDFTVPDLHNFISNGFISHNTLMAKAVACESNVSFFAASGSEFVEMYVGVGAKRVRAIFAKAAKAVEEGGGAVIFIDEIDSVARRRGGPNSNDEREGTLNELMVAMDGFNTNDRVVVIGATNRLDQLDPAILRPGRFTRKIHLPLPDRIGREAILRVHAVGKPLSSEVDLTALARMTSGLSGADLADLLNEAAIFAVRREGQQVSPEDIRAGTLKLILGVGRQRSMPPRERSIIAAHESGHAICGRVTGDNVRIDHISLFQHGEALGVTVAPQLEDDNLPSESRLRASLVRLMGGRVAEELCFHELTGGASNDFEKATTIARAMVEQWGLGHDPSESEAGVTGRGSLSVIVGSSSSPEMEARRERAVAGILDRAYAEARRILLSEREQLDRVAAYLFERERIDGDEFAAVFEGRLTPTNTVLGAWRDAASKPRDWTELEGMALESAAISAPAPASGPVLATRHRSKLAKRARLTELVYHRLRNRLFGHRASS